MENHQPDVLSHGSQLRFDRKDISSLLMYTRENFFRKINRSLSAFVPSGGHKSFRAHEEDSQKIFFFTSRRRDVIQRRSTRSFVWEIYKKLTNTKLSRPEILEIPEKRPHSIAESEYNFEEVMKLDEEIQFSRYFGLQIIEELRSNQEQRREDNIK